MRRFITLSFYILFLCFLTPNSYSQVGINTTTPDPSAILDIESTTQGMLTPRMETADRIAILAPAEGLLVFDTDEDAFYYFDSTVWVPLEGAEKRDNYKLVKSDADLAVELANGGGTEYLLDTSILYEINGTINLAAPINLNNAYITGRDTNEDVLSRSGGAIFSGTKGGSIRSLSLTAPSGGTVFNLAGAVTDTVIFRDCVVYNSGSIGSLSGFGLVFISIVQFVGNINGVTYSNINQLLLNSTGWDSTNGNTYETFVGTFDIISRQGGFSKVTTATAAIDITGITSITGGASMSYVNFFGGGNYVNGSSPYTGYNFTNDWDINCPGLKVETDNEATGDINLDYPVGFGATTTFSTTGTGSRTKIAGNTASNNLFRFTSVSNNRISYDGNKTRYFGVYASVSFLGTVATDIFVFYFAKNGVVLPNTKTYRRIGTSSDIGAISIIGPIELSKGDYVEVWGERYSGSGNILVVSLNLIAN